MSQDTADPITVSEGVTTRTSLTALLQTNQSEESSPTKPLDKTTPAEPAVPYKEETSVDKVPLNSGLAQAESELAESGGTVVADTVCVTEKPKGLKDLLTAGVEDKYNADGSPVQVEPGNDDMIKVSTI